MERNGRDYLAPTLAVRERWHRRHALLGVALLLVLGVMPAVGPHWFAFDAEALLAGVDHVGALCVAALHLLMAPVHHGYHLLLVVGAGYAVLDRVVAWRRLRAALAPLDARLPVPGDAFWRAAEAGGLDPSRVRVVAGLPNPAFTVGLLEPRVYVARELAVRLSADELAAVLAHEGAHVARRDPLRVMLLRGAACALFWIPVLRRLADDLRDESEVIADDLAAARGRALALASAILSLAEWRGERHALPAGAVGFYRGDLLERRVRRLAGEGFVVRSHVTARSAVGAALALAVVWASMVPAAYAGHPLPGTRAGAVAAEAHCEHHGENPLQHLFCRRDAANHDRDCPHVAAAQQGVGGPDGHADHAAPAAS